MADPITSEELRALAIHSYADDVRPTLRTGDLLFCSGTYWPSRLIRLATRSAWSHVGLIVRLDAFDRVLLLESVENAGVRFAPLSHYLDGYKGRRPYAGQIVEARPADAAGVDPVALTSFGLDQLALPYNTAEIVRIMLRIVLNIGFGRSPIPAPRPLYICSELVESCLRQVGLAVPRGVKAYITPGDIWNAPAVSLLARIR